MILRQFFRKSGKSRRFSRHGNVGPMKPVHQVMIVAFRWILMMKLKPMKITISET